MTWTRRTFLGRVAAAAGYRAMYTAMQALGLLATTSEASPLPDLPPNFGAGKKVIILGGGIAGLVSAYELRKAGFTCTILEARERPGGRNWSVRNGCKVEFTDGAVQTCDWEEGHYLNVGPARLPSIHRVMIEYCEDLGVPLEVEINTSRSTLMQADTLNGGKPVEQRQVVNDTRGYISELLAKSIDQHGLDKLLDKEDTQRMLDFLQTYGDLTNDYSYKGSQRSGFVVSPGAGPDEEKWHQPLSLHELLVSDFSTGELYEEQIDWQATMFQPIGGMDRIPYAFAKSLGDIVQYRCVVKKVGKSSSGVKVEYANAGSSQEIEADYCICTLPLTILRTLDIDCALEKKQAFKGMKLASLYKIGWEAPRFWEKQYNIYGGISFPKQTVDLVWYPSNGLFTKTGIILSGFNFEQKDFADGSPTAFGALSTQGKLDASRAAVEVLHPGHGRSLTKPIYVSWQKIPYSLGCLAMNMMPDTKPAYNELNKPDGRIYFAGDYLSHIVGWQEGAALSAHRAIHGIAEQMRSS
ncbi:FAD-dependent oxidoreductase [Alloacidobacterium dinghuense]|uniref:Tryptophan 2-monooxygenase n=1 Tax=Alloacidobacterium dinghuense TaxID=2763107 RepID=A0A7G8BCE7_9BACT|nr:FAD-dependent oxidoreductase [Alloacidobacterium dinghuense]QNI30217.1 FAD-dependent oxidoreductase [Alloacidobacterium dinghuense]